MCQGVVKLREIGDGGNIERLGLSELRGWWGGRQIEDVRSEESDGACVLVAEERVAQFDVLLAQVTSKDMGGGMTIIC